MKNLVTKVNGLVALALAVPDPTNSGDVRVLGAGLTAVAITDRATTATINDGTSAQGLADGEASAYIAGCSIVMKLQLDGAITQYAKVYVTAAGVYTATASGNKFIGYALGALAAAGKVDVAITNA